MGEEIKRALCRALAGIQHASNVVTVWPYVAAAWAAMSAGIWSYWTALSWPALFLACGALVPAFACFGVSVNIIKSAEKEKHLYVASAIFLLGGCVALVGALWFAMSQKSLMSATVAPAVQQSTSVKQPAHVYLSATRIESIATNSTIEMAGQMAVDAKNLTVFVDWSRNGSPQRVRIAEISDKTKNEPVRLTVVQSIFRPGRQDPYFFWGNNQSEPIPDEPSFVFPIVICIFIKGPDGEQKIPATLLRISRFKGDPPFLTTISAPAPIEGCR